MEKPHVSPPVHPHLNTTNHSIPIIDANQGIDMRLLKRHQDGQLSLTKDLHAGEIPPYAILSHTWSLHEDDEVTFEDFKSAQARHKKSYTKLEFCAEQAHKDGLNFCWIDTCCINRHSESELSQAIRSMYRWYRDSKKCYVYLSDVGGKYSFPDERKFQHVLVDSRWFERWWTVQEMLAPQSVEFFTPDGVKIGALQEHIGLIRKRTGIPEDALRGADMNLFTIEEKLAWFDGRQTKREEDIIYASLGLFNVHIPILYGEGVDSARARLRTALRNSPTASEHNSNLVDPGKAIQNRRPLLFSVIGWLCIIAVFFVLLSFVTTLYDMHLRITSYISALNLELDPRDDEWLYSKTLPVEVTAINLAYRGQKTSLSSKRIGKCVGHVPETPCEQNNCMAVLGVDAKKNSQSGLADDTETLDDPES